jgi:hypothetical protein
MLPNLSNLTIYQKSYYKKEMMRHQILLVKIIYNYKLYWIFNNQQIYSHSLDKISKDKFKH